MTTTVTTSCQQVYTQDHMSVQPSNLINEACNTISAIGKFQDIASCIGTGVTIISCLFSETGIGAVICAGTLDLTVDSLAPECAQFIETQLAQHFLGSQGATLLQQYFILQDPTNPQNILTEACIALQSLFPPGQPHVYVADSASNTILAYDSQGNPVQLSGGFPGLSVPDGFAYDPSNQHFYVTNLGNSTVTVYDTSGNLITLGSGAFVGLNDPEDITFDPVNRYFYINEPGPSLVLVFDESGNPVSVASGAFPGLNQPYGVGWDSLNGLIYVTNFGTASITVYDQSGNQVSVSGSFPGLIAPDDISWDPVTGNLYVTNAESDGFGGCINSQINVFSPDGSPAAVSGGFPGLNGPDDIQSDGNAVSPTYYVANICGGTITTYDGQGNSKSTTGNFPGLTAPTGIVVVP